MSNYSEAIEHQIMPDLGRVQLSSLRIRDVQRMLDRMRSDRLSPRYIGHVRSVLRSAISHAQHMELVERNVAALAVAPPLRRTERRALSREELSRLFAALEGERLKPMIVTMGTLALRRGEAIALRWGDIDLDEGTLTVRRTGTRQQRKYVEGVPKTERSRRTLSLPAFLVTMLRPLRGSPLAYVFSGEMGGPCSAHAIELALKRGLKRAGIQEHVRIHDLRHSAISALLAAGGTPQAAQALAGHTSITLTMDLYGHFMPDQRKATANLIEGTFGSALA